MKMVTQCQIDGTDYVAVPTFRHISITLHPCGHMPLTLVAGCCRGCAFEGDSDLEIQRCGNSPECNGGDRDGQPIVWVRKQS